MNDIDRLAAELIHARDVVRLAGPSPALALVDRHLRRALDLAGVRVLDATGQRVDDRIHDVLAVRPAGDPAATGTVCETVVAGYALDQRLLRPQQVIVFTDGTP